MSNKAERDERFNTQGMLCCSCIVVAWSGNTIVVRRCSLHSKKINSFRLKTFT